MMTVESTLLKRLITRISELYFFLFALVLCKLDSAAVYLIVVLIYSNVVFLAHLRRWKKKLVPN